MFEVPPEIFPQSTLELLLNVYNAMLLVFFGMVRSLEKQSLFLAVTCAIVGFVVAASVRLLIWPPHERAIKRMRSWLQSHLQRPNLFCAAVGVATALLAFVIPRGLVTTTAIVLALPLFAAYQTGRASGEELIQKNRCSAESERLPKRCAKVTFEDGTSVVGLYIASNERALALQESGRTVIHYQRCASMQLGSANGGVSKEQ